LGLFTAMPALAQSSVASPPAATPAPATATAPAVPADFKPGAAISDTNGGVVGDVVKAGPASNGQMAVVLSIDGKDVSLPMNLFTVSGGVVVSSASKAQIQAAMSKG
jgi:hypothetical protein